jgi:hypothetical protein
MLISIHTVVISRRNSELPRLMFALKEGRELYEYLCLH